MKDIGMAILIVFTIALAACLVAILITSCAVHDPYSTVAHDVMYFDDQGHYMATEHWTNGKVTTSR